MDKVSGEEDKLAITQAIAENLKTRKKAMEKITSSQKASMVVNETIEQAINFKAQNPNTPTHLIDKELVALTESVINQSNVKTIVAAQIAEIKYTDLEPMIIQSNTVTASYEKDLLDNNIHIQNPISQKITIDMSASNKNRQNIIIDKIGINRMYVKGIDSVVIDGTSATMEVPVKVLTELNKTSDVEFEINKVEGSFLSKDQQSLAGNHEVYEFKALANEAIIHRFNQPVTLTLPYKEPVTDPAQIVVYALTEDGELKAMAGHYNDIDQTVSFKTAHFSEFTAMACEKNYADLNTYAWAEKQIKAMAAQEILDETSAYTFSPYKTVTDQEIGLSINKIMQDDIIANDSDVQGEEKPVTNQLLANYIYKAIEASGYVGDSQSDYDQPMPDQPLVDDNKLAVETIIREGITKGLPHQTFDPQHQPTKGEVAVMLYNLQELLYN
jgi:hypothetical protein